jgi:hypothetical protein
MLIAPPLVAPRLIARRSMLIAGGSILAGNGTFAQVRDDWLGVYEGTIAFRRSLPLEDIQPPSSVPKPDPDDRKPIVIRLKLRREGGGIAINMRISDGPMQTADAGETLYFDALSAGVANLAGSEATTTLRTATLLVRPDSLGTEAMFSHSDGNFWRRHLNLKFTPSGAEVILWVFDAEGTRARTWRGEVVRRPF